MMPGETGLEILPKLRAAKPETMVVMMSGNATIETAVQATRPARTTSSRSRCPATSVLITRRRTRCRSRGCAPRTSACCAADFSMIGKGAAMKGIFDKVAKTAPSSGRVLDHRRERHRQGAGRARDPRALAARRRAVREAQLRRDPES